MRLCLVLLIFVTLSCSQSGGLSKGNNTNNLTDNTGDFNSSSSTNSSGSSSSLGALRGIAMRYQFPEIPTAGKDEQYYVTNFADINLGDLKPKEDQVKLSGRQPAEQLKIELTDNADGSNYCFSNDQHEGGPLCAPANPTIVKHVKELQGTPTGKHPVFISALQFSFRSAPKAAGGNYTEPFFVSAYVEKAPIVFTKSTGKLAEVTDANLMKLSYGTNDCNINDQDAVGFNQPTYMNDEYYLSGIWSFERAGRQVFGNEGNKVQEAKICTTQGVGDYFCNLFADKVSVWHALLVPVLYTSGNVTHRQDPADAIIDSKLVRKPGAQVTTFGRYANTNTTFVTTPVIGQVDANGNEVKDWQKYYIRKFCIKGYRLEHSSAGESRVPLIQAMRFELRSPYVKKFR